MSDVLSAEDASALTARLYAALKHEKGCSCGKCSGGLNAVDALARSHEQLRGERDAALDRESETSDTLDADRQEIARLREFGEHYSGAAQDAWDRIAVLEKALREIADQQPAVLAYIEANGFVFDSIGRQPGNWQHLAFSIYTDLCEVDTIARAALHAAAAVSTEPAPE